MRRVLLTVSLALALAGVAVQAAAAQSAPATPPAPTPQPAAEGTTGPAGALATFQGRTIDLGRSWEGADTCEVRGGGDVRCSVRPKPGKDVAGTTGASKAEVSGYYNCPSGWFCLYEGFSYTGRMLKFREMNVCQSLVPYNFHNKASSAVNHSNAVAYLYQSLRDFDCWKLLWIINRPPDNVYASLGVATENQVDAIDLERI